MEQVIGLAVAKYDLSWPVACVKRASIEEEGPLLLLLDVDPFDARILDYHKTWERFDEWWRFSPLNRAAYTRDATNFSFRVSPRICVGKKRKVSRDDYMVGKIHLSTDNRYLKELKGRLTRLKELLIQIFKIFSYNSRKMEDALRKSHHPE